MTMRVQVEVLCAPDTPVAAIEESLQAAGDQLASRKDSVSVEVLEGEPLTGVLEFEMRRAARHRVVDAIWEEVKFWTWAFREDITIRFPKDKA
jgi:hypothetical protein